MKKRIIIAVLCFAVATAMCGCGLREDESQSGGNAAVQSSDYIGMDKAEEIVLEHSGYTADDVRFTKEKLDTDDGKAEYDIEFFADGADYEYEIDAVTGDILKAEREGKVIDENQSTDKTDPDGYIGTEKAKEIALEHSGYTADDVRFTKEKLDTDDGKAEYDIEFFADGVDYEYEIDAVTGDILKAEREGKVIDQNQSTDKTDPDGYIGTEKAKEIALEHSGYTADDVRFTKEKLDTDDGKAEYDIEFFADGADYEYEIDAVTGDILKAEREGKVIDENQSTDKTDPDGYIGTEKAKEIALEHSGYTADDVRFTKEKLDTDDGKAEYDIEFFADGADYEYEIDAVTGDILKAEREGKVIDENQSTDKTDPDGYIGTEKAKEIALEHSGYTADDVRFTKEKLDTDDGKAEYDIEFFADGVDYEYEIDAVTGDILKAEREGNNTNQNVSGDNSSQTSYIGADRAKEIALSDAGLNASDVRFTKEELDADDIRPDYDIEFIADGIEYEYEIDAVTGKF